MATFSAPFSAPGTSAVINLVLVVNVASQNTSANTSSVSWNFYMEEVVNASPYRSAATTAANATVYVPVFSANISYDFRATNAVNGIGSGSVTVPHNSSGAATISVSASVSDAAPQIIGSASFSTTMALPTIPRGGADHWNGSAWAMQMVEHWNGSAWVLQTVEHYNGSAWVRQI